jgi:hypothetical protein
MLSALKTYMLIGAVAQLHVRTTVIPALWCSRITLRASTLAGARIAAGRIHLRTIGPLEVGTHSKPSRSGTVDERRPSDAIALSHSVAWRMPYVSRGSSVLADWRVVQEPTMATGTASRSPRSRDCVRVHRRKSGRAAQLSCYAPSLSSTRRTPSCVSPSR